MVLFHSNSIHSSLVTTYRSTHGLLRLLSITIIVALSGFPLSSAQNDGTISLRENTPIGTMIASLAGSTIQANCEDPSTVQVKSGLVQLDSSWSLLTRAEIDRETADCDLKLSKSEINCIVKISIFCSGGGKFGFVDVLLDILDTNDNSPSFKKEKVFLSMPENVPQNSMWALDVASDPDSHQYGVNKYSLVCVNCDQDSEGVFRLVDDERRGTDNAILPKLELRLPLDYEEKELFVFNISAYDSDNNMDSYQLFINVSDINDNAPIFAQSTLKSTIPEDQQVGSVVGNVEAHDLDSGRNGEIEFGFSAQESLPDTMASFQIDPVTGDITLVKSLKNQGGKDHEVIIYARDKADSPLKDEMTWKFSILEKNDFVPQINYISLENSEGCQIPENNEVGHVVGYFEVTDTDDGVFGETEFRMVNGSSLFELNENNGMYFVKLLTVFNREEQESYVVTVRAWDCRSDPTCDRLETLVPMEFLVCDENDNNPMFQDRELKLEIVEEQPPAVLAKFHAFDKDTGLNGMVEYFIPEFDLSSFFSIDNATGEVYSVKPLDRELLGDQVEIPVAASDKGQPVQTSTARLFIKLEDINDNAPRFVNPPTFLNLFENSKPGVSIGTIKAVDDDKERARVFYSATPNSSQYFRIDRTSGQVSAIREFDYEKEDERVFDFFIKAQEDTAEALFSILPVKIKVIDRNDNTPVIDSVEDMVDVPWDADENFEVTRIQAHDDDSNENGRLNYILLNEQDRFDINRKTGILLVRERLDIYRDRDATFRVMIEVRDSASLNALSSKTAIHVTFSGNITLYNHTQTESIRLPMEWSDIEGFIVYIACGTVVFVVLIIIAWVALVMKCRRSSYRDHGRNNSKYLLTEQDVQFNNTSKRASGHFGSYVRPQNVNFPIDGNGSMPPAYMRGNLTVQSSNDPESRDLSPNSMGNVDDSVIFANEMHASDSITNIHENPLALAAASPTAPIGGLTSSQSSFEAPHQGHLTGQRSSIATPGGLGQFAQMPSPLPKLKLDLQTVDPCNPSTDPKLPYNYSVGSMGRQPPASSQGPLGYNSYPAAVLSGRRQVSEPADASNLTVQFSPDPTNKRVNSNAPGSNRQDVRSSNSPEPTGSDSSSFDSGRGSEAQMDGLAFNSSSLIRGKKSRHTPPAPMYGDHREDDCWQPRASESSTLPGNRQANNPDIPTKGGILITPARQILQPPASNHEKWNLPRDANTFKQNSGQQSSPGANSNSNGNLNRIGLTELEPIAENIALERKRDQNYIPDIVKSSAQSLITSGNSKSLKQQPQYSPAPISSVRTTLPPKRTPPSIPIDGSDTGTAVV